MHCCTEGLALQCLSFVYLNVDVMHFVGAHCLYEPIFCTTNLVSMVNMQTEVHMMKSLLPQYKSYIT